MSDEVFYVDPATLVLPPSMPGGVNLAKFWPQFSQYGTSIDGMAAGAALGVRRRRLRPVRRTHTCNADREVQSGNARPGDCRIPFERSDASPPHGRRRVTMRREESGATMESERQRLLSEFESLLEDRPNLRIGQAIGLLADRTDEHAVPMGTFDVLDADLLVAIDRMRASQVRVPDPDGSINPTERAETLRLLGDVSEVWPQWRFGQLVSLLSFASDEDFTPGGAATIEDAELAESARRLLHKTRRRDAMIEVFKVSALRANDHDDALAVA